MIDISLIYVNYFSTQEITESILSFKDALKNLKYEIIIMDNSVNEKEFENLNKKCSSKNSFIYRTNKNIGFGQACNRAAKMARGKYLFFINPDTRYFRGKIESLISFYEKNHRCGIAAPLLLNEDLSLQYSARKFPSVFNQLYGRNSLMAKLKGNNIFSSDYMYINADYSKPLKVDWVRAAAIIIKRGLFISIGGFSKQFFMFVEDTDLCKRLTDYGYSVYVYPGLSVIHKLGSTVEKAPIKKIWMHHKSLFIYFSKRQGKLLTLFLFIAVIMRIIVLATAEGIK